MVQIQAAKQESMRKSIAASVPLLEPGAEGILGAVEEDGKVSGKIAIDGMRAGEFVCKTIALCDQPEHGWEVDSTRVDQDTVDALRGVVADSVRLVRPESEDREDQVEVTVIDFTREEIEEPRQLATYVGALSDFRWHRVDN